MRTALITALLLLAFAASALPQALTGNPLQGLDAPKDFKTLRSSSSDPNWYHSNGDARGIGPNSSLTIAELEGPGRITHIWFTIMHPARFHPRQMTLRIWWDGEKNPSVEAPIGDFFVIGHGMDVPFVSLPVKVSSDGRARNCYWPMPFAKSARIEVSNDCGEPCQALFWYVDWQKLPSLPRGTPYFHAMYRQEYPTIMGRNYLLADIRGKGHYVGTVQSVYHTSPGWYGEGDDFFFIDGEKEPSLRGTGTEDYFCDAWGFREQDGPYYGTPIWEGFDTGDRGTSYRWHIADAVAFEKSLRVEIEDWGSQNFPDGTFSGFIERDDLMSSVAYWYQTEPHKPWPALPAGKDRLPFTESVVAEGEAMVEGATHSQHVLTTQDLGGMSGGKQLFFNPTDQDAWVEVTFDLAEETLGQLVVVMVKSWDYGKYRALLDGRPLGTWDLVSDNVVADEHKLPFQKLAAGKHNLRFECVGKSPESRGFFLGFDAILLRTPVYYRDPSKDLRDLQVK